jgi:hypothetical protein
MAISLHVQTYKIRGEEVRVVGDYVSQLVYMHARGFSKTYPMSEYNYFNGDMKDFVISKLKEEQNEEQSDG